MAYFGTRKYNAYRKRSFTLTDNQRREYAKQMDEMFEWFQDSEWSLSSAQDSAYKSFENYQVRLSNHSADNQYHDLNSDRLLVNIKASKLNFKDIIENDLAKVLAFINKLDLSQYRFINITNDKINCFYKGYKTKKEVFDR